MPTDPGVVDKNEKQVVGGGVWRGSSAWPVARSRMKMMEMAEWVGRKMAEWTWDGPNWAKMGQAGCSGRGQTQAWGAL